jgi:uncharacterized membrane protein YebE (DUF533 family)
MFDANDLVRGVLTGVMGGRRKRSKKALRYLTGRGGSMLSNPSTLLTVAGVAWGIFETLQNQAPPAPMPAASSPAEAPLPATPGAASIPADALTMIRLAIAAAYADGTLSDADRSKILEQARTMGASHVVEYELVNRQPLADIVAGITDPAQRATLYVLAFGVIRADESVSGAERIFLAQLANQLGLDPATVSKLEADAAARIDSQE